MSAQSLVEQLKSGLDAPICLTWELTYACNLQCVHCLSSSGQRDPRELTTAEAKRVLDELRELQVFYINIGGGEPMIRRDFFELVEYAIDPAAAAAARHRREVLDQRHLHRRRQRSPPGRDGLPRHPDQPRRHRRRHQRRGARRGLVRHRPTSDGQPGCRRLRPVQDQRRRHPPQRRPARRVQGTRRLVRRPAAHHPSATEWARRRHVARPAPDQRPAAADLRLAAGQGRRRC